MPYVNEAKSQNTIVISSLEGPTVNSWTTHLPSLAATQYGWRSAGELDAARADSFSTQQGANWADTLSVAQSLERVERAMTSPIVRGPGAAVHKRLYTEFKASPVTGDFTVGVPGSAPVWRVKPPIWVASIGNPASPTDGDLRAVGGNLLRASVPTKPHSNMAQWFGELRQFGSGFSVPTEMPKELWHKPGLVGEVRRLQEGGKMVGSAHLAGQFAWIPFLSEFLKATETVAHSGPIIEQYLRDSSRLIRRTNSRVTYQGASTVQCAISGSGTAAQTPRFSTRTVEGTEVTVGWKPTFGNSNWTLAAESFLTVSRTDEYRTSALWEYFAADPTGTFGANFSTAQKLRRLFGDPLLSFATLWELTPWSWLVDWNYNIGSFLSFQESVSADSLAARRTCTVFERRVNVTFHAFPKYLTGSWKGQGPPAITSASFVYQDRGKGNPYGMGIDWSGFSSQRWFILGALGLALAPGVPG